MSGLISTNLTVSGGSVITNASQRYTIADAYGTAIGHGDPVVVDATSGHLIKCPETRVPDGVLRGIQYFDANGQLQFLSWFPAGTTNTGSIDGTTDVVAIVEPAENRLFRIRATGNVAQTDIGDIKRLSDNTVLANGLAGTTVNMVGAITAEVRLVRIRDLDRRPGNVFGATPVLVVELIDPDASTL